MLSAIDRGLIYIDGHNNPGFSGGPVIFAHISERDALTIGGAVAGYRSQTQRVLELKDLPTPTTGDRGRAGPRFVLENTGIVIAHSIGEVERAVSQA